MSLYGASSGVGFYVRRHSDWKYGSFDLKVHWSTSESGGDVSFVVTITPVTFDSAFVEPTECGFLVTPGVADIPKVSTLMSSALRQQSLVERSKAGVYVRLLRSDLGESFVDTNPGIVSIYGIELIYNEAKRVIGDAIKK